MRRFLVFCWLTTLMVAIAAIFWYSDFVYRLPTPVPETYMPVPLGTNVGLPYSIARQHSKSGKPKETGARKPTFLHFFNPDCPCSRFNMAHVRKLIQENRSKAHFNLVLVSLKTYSPEEIQERFGIDIPVINDDSLSVRYGVYSTPQAVIIDTNNNLYYRGNYNRSRYCTDKKTNYAEIALKALLKNDTGTTADLLATKAYGCELPGCEKQ